MDGPVQEQAGEYIYALQTYPLHKMLFVDENLGCADEMRGVYDSGRRLTV